MIIFSKKYFHLIKIFFLIISFLFVTPQPAFSKKSPPLEISDIEKDSSKFYLEKGGVSEFYEYRKQFWLAYNKKILLSKLTKFEKWISTQNKVLVNLTKTSKNLEKEIATLTGEIANSEMININSYGLKSIKRKKNGQEGELLYIFSMLSNELSNSKGRCTEKVKALALELSAAVTRLDSLNQWMVLQLKWMKRDAEMLREYLKPISKILYNGDAKVEFRGFFEAIPTGFDINARYEDIKEIIRQAKDVLTVDYAEKGEIGKSLEHSGLYYADIELRDYIKKVFEKTDEKVLTILDSCFSDTYHITYLNHVFWKYKEDKCEPANVATVLNRWGKWFTPKKDNLNTKKLALLEVLNYKQGTIHSCRKADERFHKKIFSTSDIVINGDLKEISSKIEKVRDFSDADLKEIFPNRTIDCYVRATQAGVRLANRGCSGVYPYIQFGADSNAADFETGETPKNITINRITHHAEVFFKTKERYWSQAYQYGKKHFPPKNDEQAWQTSDEATFDARYIRTIASWTWSEMFTMKSNTIYINEIPYYELKADEYQLK